MSGIFINYRQNYYPGPAPAFAAPTHVLPVLIDKARLPGHRELPGSITDLALCQAHRIQFGHWQRDVKPPHPRSGTVCTGGDHATGAGRTTPAGATLVRDDRRRAAR